MASRVSRPPRAAKFRKPMLQAMLPRPLKGGMNGDDVIKGARVDSSESFPGAMACIRYTSKEGPKLRCYGTG